MYPPFLITLNEKPENFPVTVQVGQVSFFFLFTLFQGMLTSFLQTGHCRWSGWKAKNNIWVPDGTSITGATWDYRRAGRTGNRGVHSI